MRSLTVLLLSIPLLLHCGEHVEKSAIPASVPAPADDVGTPLHKAWWVATHNSYWVDRGFDDPFAGGVGLRLLDQVLVHGARTVEIDIHRSRTMPGEFDVYHTTPGNGICPTLRQCLSELRGLQTALPQHEVVHIVLEFKEIYEPFFDATHTIADLDRVLREEFGASLYQPGDLMARCRKGSPTLRDCVAARGWPSVEFLRGRFIVVMLGNWDDIGKAANTAAWAQYASSGPIRDRAAFPMASAWKLDYAKLPYYVTDLISEADLRLAERQSPYLQIEDLKDPQIAPFLASNGIIRAGAADTLASQEEKLRLGIQILQTDFPWVRPEGPAGRSPLRAFAKGATALVEPGAVVTLASPGTGATDAARGKWYSIGSAKFFAATLSSGRSARPACVAVSLGSAGTDSIGFCRAKIDQPGTKTNQAAAYSMLRCAAAGCTLSPSGAAESIGERIGIALTSANGEACVVPTIVSAIGADGVSAWKKLPLLCSPGSAARVGVVTLAPDGVTDSTVAAGLELRTAVDGDVVSMDQ